MVELAGVHLSDAAAVTVLIPDGSASSQEAWAWRRACGVACRSMPERSIAGF